MKKSEKKPLSATEKRDERRQRLYDIKRETQSDMVSATGEQQSEGGRLNEFIKDLSQKKANRQFQLGLIQDFFEDPEQFGIELDNIPCSTTPEEINERKKELEYRISLLQSILEALQGEMQMLDMALKSSAQAESSEPNT